MIKNDSVFGAISNKIDYITEYHLNDDLKKYSSFNKIRDNKNKKNHKWLEDEHPIFFNPRSIFPSLKIPVREILFEGRTDDEIIDNIVKKNLYFVIEIEEEMILKLVWFSEGFTPNEIIEKKLPLPSFKYYV